MYSRLMKNPIFNELWILLFFYLRYILNFFSANKRKLLLSYTLIRNLRGLKSCFFGYFFFIQRKILWHKLHTFMPLKIAFTYVICFWKRKNRLWYTDYFFSLYKLYKNLVRYIYFLCRWRLRCKRLFYVSPEYKIANLLET